MSERRRLWTAVGITLTLLTAVLGIPYLTTPRTPAVVADPGVLSVKAECQQALGYASRSTDDLAWIQTCITALTPPEDATTPPTASPTSTTEPSNPPPTQTTTPPGSPPATTPATTPTSTPPPTTTPSTPTATPTTSPPTSPGVPPAPAFPNADTTGVPADVTLVAHTGSCTITTAGARISGQLFNCDVIIRAADVQIVNTRINGTIQNDPTSTNAAFSLTDSEVNCAPGAPRQVTCIAHNNFVVNRVEVTGGNRGIYCQRTCVVTDSYVHGTKITANWHASAIRMEQGGIIRHNTLVCDAPVQADPEGSCSATLTGYGDYAAVQNNQILNNLFLATRYAAYCAYGGSSKGKPFSGQANNIVFKDNVFQRGTASTNGSCALYGPIGDWDPTRPGNQWVNNRYSDGVVIPNKVY